MNAAHTEKAEQEGEVEVTTYYRAGRDWPLPGTLPIALACPSSDTGFYRAGRDRPLPWTIRVLPACLACQALPT